MTTKKLYRIATIEALKETKADFDKMIDEMAEKFAERKVKIVTGKVTGEEKELLEAEVEMLLIQGRIAHVSKVSIMEEIKKLESEISEGTEEVDNDVEELMKFIKELLGL